MSEGKATQLLVRNVATLAAAFAAVWLGVHTLAGFSGRGGEPLVSPIWPATGINIALLWLLGFRVLPGLVVGATLANLTIAPEVPRLIAYTSAQVTEATVAVWLLRVVARNPSPRLHTRRAAFSLLAAGIAGPLAAVLVAGVLLKLMVAPDIGKGGVDWRFWSAWLISDGLSAIVITPVAVSWRERQPIPWTKYPALQAAGIVAGLVGASAWLFGGAMDTGWLRPEPLVFLTLPLLVWAALSFGSWGASIAVLGLAIMSIAGTVMGHGPFGVLPPVEGALLLQIYLGVAAVTALLLGASTCARGADHRALEAQHEHVRQLLRELDHRVRNNLAALVGLAQIAKREARAAGLEIGSVDRAAGRGEGASLATFESRVMAMGRIHALLSRSRWSEARLSELIASVVEPEAPGEGKRLVVRGDDPVLRAEQCQAMALSLHELATNACKHGAWSGGEGVVEIRGESGGGAETMLWTERGGATTQRKERALDESGGLKLVRGFVSHELRGKFDVRMGAEGIEVVIRLPAAEGIGMGM